MKAGIAPPANIFGPFLMNRCWLIIFLRGAFMASGQSDAIPEIDGCASGGD